MLTGQTTFRQNWLGKLILQVGETYTYYPFGEWVNKDTPPGHRFRDATEADLQQLQIKTELSC